VVYYGALLALSYLCLASHSITGWGLVGKLSSGFISLGLRGLPLLFCRYDEGGRNRFPIELDRIENITDIPASKAPLITKISVYRTISLVFNCIYQV
jgi:hypothetical protein